MTTGTYSSRFSAPARDGYRWLPRTAMDAVARKPRRLRVVLPAIRPNVGLQAAFRRELVKMLSEMQASVEYWVRAAYRANEPEIAMDASPARTLQRTVDKLTKQWQDKFNELAPATAKRFATKMLTRADRQMEAALRAEGLSVAFKMTRPMNDVMQATVQEQASLISNLSSQQLQRVQGVIMRSVTVGRDLETMTKELRSSFGIAKRRAELIARDQNNKATATMNRVRQSELGITKAVWVHSSAGKTPRPTHVANNGKTYNVAKGWFDPDVGEYIWPGTEINCRCTSRSIIEGFIP
jgi:SPP1 gp7 family putative phage head morphogenesis protein